MFSYGLSEREAGSDTAAMRCRARADGDDWVLSGQKSWITNAGISQYYTVLAVTDPEARRGAGISAFVVERSDAGFTFGEPEKKMGIKGSPTRELHLRRRAAARRPHGRRAGRGPEDRAAHARPHPRHHRGSSYRVIPNGCPRSTSCARSPRTASPRTSCPEALVVRAELPLTAGEKVDRRALVAEMGEHLA